MKNTIYILLILLLSSSCTVFKKVIKDKESVSTSTQSVIAKYDSIFKVSKSKAIYDNFSFVVPKSHTNNKKSDSIVDARLDEILAKLNYKKQSGSNSYQMSYNPEKREIETSVKVGATADTTRTTTKELKKTTEESTFIKSVTKKTGIPIKWLLIAAIVLLRKQLFWVLRKFFPVLETLTIVKYFK